jgi:hypothetical protein
MVQIVEHRAETSTDFLVEEEVVSSTPQVPDRPVPGAAAVHAARQHTAAQTSRTPSRALKGKCVFGPFLSILVIKCQHKCLNVNQCP